MFKFYSLSSIIWTAQMMCVLFVSASRQGFHHTRIVKKNLRQDGSHFPMYSFNSRLVFVGQFETGRAEIVSQSQLSVDPSEETNFVNQFRLDARASLCIASGKYLVPQIILHSSQFWKWFQKMPNDMGCHLTDHLMMSTVECPADGWSSLTVALPQNYVFMGCVNDETGIVRKFPWRIMPGMDHLDSFLTLWEYNETLSMHVELQYGYNKKNDTKPICTRSLFYYDKTNVSNTLTCWCKGDFCSYLLFNHAGFNPGPFVHFEAKFKKALIDSEESSLAWYAQPRIWVLIILPCLVLILFCIIVIPLCKSSHHKKPNRVPYYGYSENMTTESTLGDDSIMTKADKTKLPYLIEHRNVEPSHVLHRGDYERKEKGAIAKAEFCTPMAYNQETESDRSLKDY